MTSVASGFHLVFHRHQARYALPLHLVREIVCIPELVVVENMPEHVVGVFNYHGRLVPVMNLDGPLGHVSFRYKISDNVILLQWDETICGLIVDDTRDLENIQLDEIEQGNALEVSNPPHPLIAHVVPHDAGAINVLHSLPLSHDRNAIQQFIRNLSDLEKNEQLVSAPKLIRGMTLLEQTLMRERTENLREADQEDLSGFTQLVVIRIDQDYFGFDLELIRECAEISRVIPIPGCPEYLVGVMNVRGEVLPIVDMRATLNVPTIENAQFHKAVVVQFENISVGIVAEEIIESVFLQSSDMVSGSLTGTAKEEGYIRGIARFHDEKILKVLDLQTLLMNGELSVDQTFSQAAPDPLQDSSEDRAEHADSEGSELRSIFMKESKVSLRELRESVMILRGHVGDEDDLADDTCLTALQKAFNQAHFLMSVARMLGARKMEIVARRVEDFLRLAKHGKNELTVNFVDSLDHGLNGIQALFDEFSTGVSTSIDPFSFCRDTSFVPIEIAQETLSEGLGHEPILQKDGGSLLVESVRLDNLMDLISDLKAVLCARQECLVDTAHLVKFSDAWNHSLFEHRAIGVKGSHSKQLVPRDEMAKFYKQESDQLAVLTNVVGRVARTVYDEHQRLSTISEAVEEHIRSMRLLSFSSFFKELTKFASDMGRDQHKEVELSVEGAEMTVDMQVLEELKGPLRQLIQNAIHHGIELPSERIQAGKPRRGALRLYAFQMGTYLLLELWDDGRGLDVEAIKQTAVENQLVTREELEKMPLPQIESLIFKPGFTTHSVSRRAAESGMGLDVVQSAVKRLKGAVYVGSTPGSGCMVQIQLPGPVPPLHLLIVSVDGQKYGIPIDQVQTTTHVQSKASWSSAGREFVSEDGKVVPLVSLAELLGKEEAAPSDQLCLCVVVVVEGKPLGCLVDEIFSEQEVKPQPQGLILKRVRNVSGSTILNTGEVCLILNSDDLIRTAEKHLAVSRHI